jgi:hypothetical protein
VIEEIRFTDSPTTVWRMADMTTKALNTAPSAAVSSKTTLALAGVELNPDLGEKNPQNDLAVAKEIASKVLTTEEAAFAEIVTESIYRSLDLPLGGKGDQAAWNSSLLTRKKYFEELSMQGVAQLNADAKVDSSLHALINAMAAFSPPAAGEIKLASNEPAGLKGTIAVDWAA